MHLCDLEAFHLVYLLFMLSYSIRLLHVGSADCCRRGMLHCRREVIGERSPWRCCRSSSSGRTTDRLTPTTHRTHPIAVPCRLVLLFGCSAVALRSRLHFHSLRLGSVYRIFGVMRLSTGILFALATAKTPVKVELLALPSGGS